MQRAARISSFTYGSPTWARTRDLRIDRRSIRSGCRPRQCSLSGVRTSNTFESFASISTGLEPRTTTGYWKRFRPRIPGCSAASITLLGRDVGIDDRHGTSARMPCPRRESSSEARFTQAMQKAFGQRNRCRGCVAREGRLHLVGDRGAQVQRGRDRRVAPWREAARVWRAARRSRGSYRNSLRRSESGSWCLSWRRAVSQQIAASAVCAR